MYQTKFSAQEIAQARKEVQQNYGRALLMYAPPPSEEEIAEVIKTLHQLKIDAAYTAFKQVVANNQKKSTNCGCGGKSASAGYSTKSITSNSKQTKSRENHFAKHFERMACESQDRAYEAFMKKCDAYL